MTGRAAGLLAGRLLAVLVATWSLWTTELAAKHSQQVRSSAPTPVAPRWYDSTNEILSLAVMLDGGAEEACAGAGIIAGYKQSIFSHSLFVLTANHVVEGIERRAGQPQLGVRFRIVTDRTYRRKEPLERRLPARVAHRDATLDLAVLEVSDGDFVEAVQSRLDYEVLGDSAHLVVADPVYGVGCGNGIDWDMPIEPAGVLLPAEGRVDETIAFERAYVREGFSGGPVAHIFESRSTLIGMTVKVDGSRVLARPIHVLLDRARAWGVPVLLIPPRTHLGCRYDVSPRVVDLSASRREALVSVTTAESCGWAVRPQTDAALAERLRWWLDASVSKPSTPRPSTPEGPPLLTLGDLAGQTRYDHTGPGTVRIAAGSGAPCDGRPVHAVVNVAGQLIRVFFTGEC